MRLEVIGEMLRCKGRETFMAGAGIDSGLPPMLTPFSIFKIRWNPSLSSDEDSFAGVGGLGEGFGASTTWGNTAVSSWGAKNEVKRDLATVLGSWRIAPSASCSVTLLLAPGVELQNPKNLSTPFSTTAGAVCGSALYSA